MAIGLDGFIAIDILVNDDLSINKHERYIEGCRSIVDNYGLVISDEGKGKIKLLFDGFTIKDRKTQEIKFRLAKLNDQDALLVAGIPRVKPSSWWAQSIGFFGCISRTFYIITRKLFYEKLAVWGVDEKYWDFCWKIYERYKNILCAIILFAIEIGIGEMRFWHKYHEWRSQQEFEKARKFWTRDVEKIVIFYKIAE